MAFSEMAKPAPGKIVDLRQLLAERFPSAAPVAPARLTTRVATLDEATGGGLPKSAITELTSPHPSTGSALLLARLLDTAARERFFLALIDGRDSFDPEPLGQARLRHLLWVRCRQAAEAVKAADFLLRDGNFPLVVLDLVLNDPAELRAVPASHWYRLQRLVEAVPSALLVLTRRSMIASAQLKLTLENSWCIEDLEAEENDARLRFAVRRAQGGRHLLAGSAG